jgi:hypothetical protein
MIGDPSDSKRSLYSCPVSSVAEQTTLETWPAAKLPSCHAPPGGGYGYRNGQTVNLWPAFRIEKHSVDRQIEQVVVRALAVLAGERNDVTWVGEVIECDSEVGPPLDAVDIGDGPAGKIMAGDVKRYAFPGHQREQIGVWRLWLGFVGNLAGNLLRIAHGLVIRLLPDDGNLRREQEAYSQDGSKQAHC